MLDGPDGSGKGTQLDRLAAWLAEQGAPPLRVRDPGGTDFGERIRHLLLDHDLGGVDPRCETLLFMAARAQLVGERIRPALAAGQTVLCDRFISATYAYQGAAGFPKDDVLALGRHAVGDTWPDVTIILDVPPEVGFERTGRKPPRGAKRGRTPAGQANLFDGATTDAMERRPLDYHRRVRELFRELPGVYPRPVEIVDATRPPDEVAAAVQEALRRVLS